MLRSAIVNIWESDKLTDAEKAKASLALVNHFIDMAHRTTDGVDIKGPEVAERGPGRVTEAAFQPGREVGSPGWKQTREDFVKGVKAISEAQGEAAEITQGRSLQVGIDQPPTIPEAEKLGEKFIRNYFSNEVDTKAIEEFVKLKFATSGLVKPEDLYPELKKSQTDSETKRSFKEVFSIAVEDFTKSIREHEEEYIRGLRKALDDLLED